MPDEIYEIVKVAQCASGEAKRVIEELDVQTTKLSGIQRESCEYRGLLSTNKRLIRDAEKNIGVLWIVLVLLILGLISAVLYVKVRFY